MKISVLGTGRWASTNIWIAVNGGHSVQCWDRFDTDFMKTKKNRYVDLSGNEKVICSHNLEETLNYGDIVIISILFTQTTLFSRERHFLFLPLIQKSNKNGEKY